MKILLDTNIVLDVLMDRLPQSEAATELFSRVEDGTAISYLCSTTITTVFYFAAKIVGTPRAQEEIRKLLQLFEVAPVNRPVLESALILDFTDFEGAVMHEAACHVGACPGPLTFHSMKPTKTSHHPPTTPLPRG